MWQRQDVRESEVNDITPEQEPTRDHRRGIIYTQETSQRIQSIQSHPYNHLGLDATNLSQNFSFIKPCV